MTSLRRPIATATRTPEPSHNNDWRTRALCAGAVTSPDDDIWFSDRPADIERAQQICGFCPVKATCRTEGDGFEGMWGGVLRKRERARPAGPDATDIDDQIMELYRNEHLDSEIAPIVGLSVTDIMLWRRKRELLSNRSRTDEHAHRKALYDAGYSDAEIARKRGAVRKTIQHWRLLQRLPANPKRR